MQCAMLCGNTADGKEIKYMIISLINKIKGLFGMDIKTIQKVLDIKPVISQEMINAQRLWRRMYSNTPDWKKEPKKGDPERVVSIGLAQRIASEKARLVCLEMKTNITPPKEENISVDKETGLSYVEYEDIGDASRAEYLNSQYNDCIIDKLRENLEYAIALGGMVFKPYLSNGEFACDFVQADEFIPMFFNSRGEITEAAFIEKLMHSDYIYTRIEHHKWENGTVTVKNRAFKAVNTTVPTDELGKEIPISTVPEWAMLAEEAVIPSDKPLFAYFKLPIANNVDSRSNLGKSVYGGGGTEDLIKDADEQYSRMIWEFEGGELALDVDRTALHEYIDEDGAYKSTVPTKQQRLYRKNDFDENVASTWNIFNPTYRDVSLINGLNDILRKIEGNCELAPGTLSDPNTVAKTAEEIRSGKPASVTSVIEIQKALQKTLEHIVYIMDVYTDLYNLATPGEYEISFEWGNGIKEDPEKEATRRMTEIDRGLSTEVDYLEYEYGLTRKQAIDRIKEIKAFNAWKARADAQAAVTADE